MQHAAVIVSLILIFGAPPIRPDAPGRKLKGVAAEAFGYFAGLPAGNLATHFKALRPAGLSQEELHKVTASLPPDGEVQPDFEGIGKLASLRPILAIYERQSQVVVKVARLPYACMAFYQRSVLIIAEDTLNILKKEELQALVAHELAHEYFWDTYYRAKSLEDGRKLSVIELLCDGIAIVTLHDSGLNPAYLMSGITRINHYNARMGAPTNAFEYPSPRERIEFYRAIIKLLPR